MATTGQDLLNMVLNLLNESSDSVIGEFESAVSGSPTLTTQQTIIDLLNKYAGRLCKTCYAWQDTGTMTYTSGALTLPLTGLTTTLGGTIWCPRQVAWNGSTLTKTDQAHADINFPTLLTDATGTPLYWFSDGQYNVSIAPAPTPGDVLKVIGYATAPLITSGTLGTSLIWITDDCSIYVAYGVAAELTRKNNEDQNMSIKLPVWTNEYNMAAQRLWVNLLQTSPAIAKAYFSPPAQMSQISESAPQ